MNILLIKIKRKFLFYLNGILSLFKLEIKNKTISNEKLLKNLIKIETPIILDIGANLGQTIIKYLKLFPKAKIHSFEPSPEIFENLSKKFKNVENLYLYNFAFGSEETNRIFYINERSHNSGFYKLKEDFKIKNFPDEKMSYKNSLNVKLNTIDDFVKKQKLAQIDILKIDTEGFEEEILKGSLETLQSNKIKYIELEIILGNVYEDKYFSFKKIEDILSQFNFRLYAINKHGNLLQNPNLTLNVLYKYEQVYK